MKNQQNQLGEGETSDPPGEEDPPDKTEKDEDNDTPDEPERNENRKNNNQESRKKNDKNGKSDKKGKNTNKSNPKGNNPATKGGKDVAQKGGQKATEKVAEKAAQETAKKAAANTAARAGAQAAAGTAAGAGLGVVLFWVIVVIVCIIIIVGIIMFILTAPGMLTEKLGEFFATIGKRFASYFGADEAKQIDNQEVYDVLDYLEEMGYDLKGYGFISQDAADANEDAGKSADYDELQGVVRKPDDAKIAEAYSQIILEYIASDNYVYIVKNFNPTTGEGVAKNVLDLFPIVGDVVVRSI